MTQIIPALKIAQAFIAEELAVNAIAVFRSETGWNARYSGPHAASIIELFGTDTLPTAFTPFTAPGAVLATLRDSHPGCHVAMAEIAWQKVCR